MTTAKVTSVSCHPTAPMRDTVSGAYRNWPNEPAAAPPPKASERQRSGRSLPKADSTMLNEQPARPKPMKTPADRLSISGVVE